MIKSQQINFLEVVLAEDERDFRQAQDKQIKRLVVSSLDKNVGGLSELEIPIDIVLLTPAGEYYVSQLYAVGGALNPPQPLSFIKNSIESYLAIPIDGVIIEASPEVGSVLMAIGAPSSSNANANAGLFYWWRWLRNRGEWERQIETNLTRGDLWGLVSAINRMREDRITQENLGELTSYQESSVRDKLVQSLFVDSQVQSEELTAQVFNGTATSGLAGEAARYLENLV